MINSSLPGLDGTRHDKITQPTVREAALDFPSQLINIRFSQANLALMEVGAIKSCILKLA